MFDAKAEEMQALVPGFLIDNAKTPGEPARKRTRKNWSQDETIRLKERYNELNQAGLSQKEITIQMQEEFDRGHLVD